MRFRDPYEAGIALAAKLSPYQGAAGVFVVAIARGGVPVGFEVAKFLSAPLDVLIIRRLLAPRGFDSALCAVNVCGKLVLDDDLPPWSTTPESPLDYFIADALGELSRQELGCRGGRAPVNLADQTILLVDNGIHTGSTVRIAMRALRKLAPARIVLAVPIAAPESRGLLESLADELVCLAWPEPFGHVGMFYQNLTRPDEEQTCQLLNQTSSAEGTTR